jgi:hypothetical protein
MAEYKFTNSSAVLRISDGVFIPNDPANRDWQEYQSWLDAGNSPDTYVEPVASILKRIDAFRDKRLAAGFADTMTGKTWQCDDASIGRWTAISASAGLSLVMSVNPEPSFTLIPADNSLVTLTASETFALFNQRAMPWVSATTIYARQMKDNVVNGNPPADITAGWP